MKKTYITIIILAILLVLVFLLFPAITQENGHNLGNDRGSALLFTNQSLSLLSKQGGSTSVIIAGSVFEVDIANTDDERTRGLSGSEDLSSNEGMLFVFEDSHPHQFWMKEMNFPIDIIWISEELKIVYMKENATVDSFPEIFIPDATALYVLEINAGIVKDKDIKIGDSIILDISSNE